MLLKEIIQAFELIDNPQASGVKVTAAFDQNQGQNKGIQVELETLKGDRGSTDLIKLVIAGSEGKLSGGNASTLGLMGWLGGVGARPDQIGAVSDADGAIVAIACGLKLVDMMKKGEALNGDVIIATHICPDAPTVPHDPVPFMGSPVDIAAMLPFAVDPQMDAVLSVDATKGNEIINVNGFAISPTVKEGYILRVSGDLLRIMKICSAGHRSPSRSRCRISRPMGTVYIISTASYSRLP